MVEPISCPSCGLLQKTAAQYCFDCGSKLTLQPNQNIALCRACNGPLIAGAPFCGSCGSPAQALPSTTPKPEPKPRSKAKPRKSKKLISALVAAPFVLLVGAIVTFSILPSINPISRQLPIEQRAFQDCEELRLYFPGGVSARGASNTGGFIDLDWQENPAAFENNVALDSDGDRIACEAEVQSYASLSCDSKNTNRILAGQKLRELERLLDEHRKAHPDPSQVTAIDALSIRNQIAQVYSELVLVPAPNYAATWWKVVDETMILSKDWSDLVTAYSSGDNNLKLDAEQRIESSEEKLYRTVKLSRERSATILPTCS